VVSQEPKGGKMVQSQTTVDLVVTGNSNDVPVPNVTGLTPPVAGDQIGAAGLNVGSQSQQCSNIGVGLVVSTNPSAGTVAPKNSQVNLIVSSGPCQVVVQNVINQTQSQATSTLQGQGLTVSAVTTTNCNPSANGTVVSQAPSAGTPAPTGSTVTISVCNATTTTSSSSTTTSSTTTTTSATTTTP